MLINADRLSGFVVDEVDFGQPEERCAPSFNSNRVLIDDPTTCSGGTP
jgi:hypothetical protein